MVRNEHNIDRGVRVTLAVVLFVIALATQSLLLGIIGLIPLFTGVVGWCPLYSIFGISTCAVQPKSQA